MEWRALAVAPAALTIAVPAHATVYFTVEQVQRALFPRATLTPLSIHITDAQKQAIERASGVTVRNRDPRVWRASSGGFLIVDQVLGKHDYITYAVALTASGAVRGLEIMEYRESYGYEIRDAAWRRQFVGKTSAAPLKLDGDISNISGATLSSRHVTEGVKRLLATYNAVLR
ncbi:MAG TPA: FMN-binding protein [Acetobacteraceae bacterium]|nr:FMN-binding protein [Acetobacteraceae bacterium]